ncbi:reticulon-like protein B8 [Phragmites australis]|uniref:reticulon-like protein B8 n=1 Tax=Phragmites australis TaxID=29695 RepID=UPI002D7A1F88|nr:reticulon-like protein B8 [Phragmites australis]XP_062188160.1 reticulon-like protein B8 [Phragmites australis]
MPEHSENAAGNIMSSIVDTIAEKLPNQKSVRFDDEGSVSNQAKRLFGGQNRRSVHHVLGGGKSADVLLWRNKKISSSVLAVATAAWVFLEWLDYHFLTIVCFMLVLGMAVQFAWSSFAGMLNGSPSNVPRVELPEELFANIGAAAGAQVNKVLGLLQDVSCGRDLKRFLLVIAGFFAAAIIGSWCNFLTVTYIGFVCAHTLPVLYEKYQDQVDDLLYNILGLLQNQYQKLDKGVLSKVPKRSSLKIRKSD